jgi:hypothetical protein
MQKNAKSTHKEGFYPGISKKLPSKRAFTPRVKALFHLKLNQLSFRMPTGTSGICSFCINSHRKGDL